MSDIKFKPTRAQRAVLNDMKAGAQLVVSWVIQTPFLYMPDGSRQRIQNRVAMAITRSGLVTRTKYDGRLRDTYILKGAA